MIKNLIFVYNADSGIINVFRDALHKIVSPDTYSCNLCVLTYNNFGMSRQWKNFIKNLHIKSEFLHKNDFESKFNKKLMYPSVLLEADGKLVIVAPAEKINRCVTIHDLMFLIENKLKKII